MIVTFCGHSKIRICKDTEQKMLAFLEEKVGSSPVDMFLGNYGKFDNFAYECCKKYKEAHPNVSLVFVTPYLTIEYQRNHLKYLQKMYDSIIYPEIESKPKRFAITYRNRYMIEKADYVVAYIDHNWGGSYATYKYAKSKGKEIFNLVDFEE